MPPLAFGAPPRPLGPVPTPLGVLRALARCAAIQVEQIIEDLELAHVADTIIGDETLRGLSGGQKRRVTVAVELVTDPSTCGPQVRPAKRIGCADDRTWAWPGPPSINPGILFLDEPTSGLVRGPTRTTYARARF